MVYFLIRRFFLILPVMLAVTFATFSMQFVGGGDPAVAAAGGETDRETVELIRKELGLDRPLFVQYGSWLGRIIKGDMGRSWLRHKIPVGEAISARIPVTMELAVLSLVVGLVIAVPAGILAAVRRNSLWDLAATMTAMIGISIPGFVVGILLILLFAVWLRWLPPSGFVPFTDNPVANLRAMLMPAFTMGIGLAAVTMRMIRSSLLEVAAQDYIRTARAKGLAERGVILRHALKNALLPVVTVVGLQIGFLLGGAVVIETVFALPGLGKLAIDSILLRDFPMVQGVVLIMSSSFVFVNLGVDVLYTYLDPRIRVK